MVTLKVLKTYLSRSINVWKTPGSGDVLAGAEVSIFNRRPTKPWTKNVI